MFLGIWIWLSSMGQQCTQWEMLVLQGGKVLQIHQVVAFHVDRLSFKVEQGTFVLAAKRIDWDKTLAAHAHQVEKPSAKKMVPRQRQASITQFQGTASTHSNFSITNEKLAEFTARNGTWRQHTAESKGAQNAAEPNKIGGESHANAELEKMEERNKVYSAKAEKVKDKIFRVTQRMSDLETQIELEKTWQRRKLLLSRLKLLEEQLVKHQGKLMMLRREARRHGAKVRDH